MFVRAQTAFPELEVTVASSDPWVLLFENLVTPEEAAQIVRACPKYERSIAGDEVSPERTSTQCWCDENGGCMEHEVVRRLTDRMLNVTLVRCCIPFASFLKRSISILAFAHRRSAPRCITLKACMTSFAKVQFQGSISTCVCRRSAPQTITLKESQTQLAV